MFQGKKKESAGETAAPKSLQGSFMRAVGRSVAPHSLGGLLLSGGLVSHDELADALTIQKDTGEPLGKILVRHGVISAVQLYRKLAKQWCVQASAAGMALMVQTAAPSIAHAEENSALQSRVQAQFQMAAATNISPASWLPAERPTAEYPELFGSHEIRSDDITPFSKWTTVMARFEGQLKAQAKAPRIMMWKDKLHKLREKPIKQQVREVNAYINKVRYIEDKDNWGKSDYWATPTEFFSRGGDCEDFAIAKYASLRALGFSSDQLRVAIVQDTIKNIPHAILIVYTEEGTFVLDNQDKRTREADRVSRYQPIFSINSTSWWLHKKAVS